MASLNNKSLICINKSPLLKGLYGILSKILLYSGYVWAYQL
jgi:hypothetical protein